MIDFPVRAPMVQKRRSTAGRAWLAPAALVGLALVLLAAYAGSETSVGMRLLAMLTAVVAAGACLEKGRSAPAAAGRGWYVIGIAAVVWAAGRIPHLQPDDPPGSGVVEHLLRHGGALSATLLLLAGLFFLRPPRRTEQRFFPVLFDLVIAVATLATVLWALIGEPVATGAARLREEQIAAIAHAVADGALLLLIFIIVLRLAPDTVAPAIRSLAVGLALVACADIVWTMRRLGGEPGSEAASAVAVAAWGVLAVRLLRDRRAARSLNARPALDASGVDDEWRLWLPYPLVVILLIIIGKEELGGGLSPRVPVMTLGSLVVIALVLGRQAMSVRAARRLTARLTDQVDRDPLTGLINHRRLHERLNLELEHGRATGQPVAVALIDVDDFKLVNDTCGHAAGDRVLQAVGALLAAACRITDVAGRYAGDEFVLILPGLELRDARAVGQRLLDQLTWLDFGMPDLLIAPAPIGLSVGFAVSRTCDMDAHRAIAIADEAMYEAKHTGKNRIAVVDADTFRLETDYIVGTAHGLVAGPGGAS